MLYVEIDSLLSKGQFIFSLFLIIACGIVTALNKMAIHGVEQYLALGITQKPCKESINLVESDTL